jgi:hypothetical protein
MQRVQRIHIIRFAAAIPVSSLVACAGDSPSAPTGRTPAALIIESGQQQSAVVAMTTDERPTVRIIDASGAGVPNVAVTFAVTAGDGWVANAATTTDASGSAATTWYLGPVPGTEQTLSVVGAGFSTTFSATAEPLSAGTTYTGANSYVRFVAGSLPLIISAPHGGTQTPGTIPDRSGPGITTVRDAETDVLAHVLRAAFEAETGNAPHVIVVELHRRKLDANREIVEAAEGNAAAERAWLEYHGFIEAARQHVIEQFGRGLYIDLHGHGHTIQRLELGYLLSATQLASDGATLNSAVLTQRSSIRTLAETGSATHVELLRGSHSLGTLFELHGYPAVPSASQPHPDGDPYFTGGYNTQRHGSRNGGPIDGVQIEANMQGVRDTGASRAGFATALVSVIDAYFAAHYDGLLSSMRN